MRLTDAALAAWAREVAHAHAAQEDRIPLLSAATTEAMRQTLADGEAHGETYEQMKGRVAAVIDGSK
jgi:hypothetical protein